MKSRKIIVLLSIAAIFFFTSCGREAVNAKPVHAYNSAEIISIISDNTDTESVINISADSSYDIIITADEALIKIANKFSHKEYWVFEDEGEVYINNEPFYVVRASCPTEDFRFTIGWYYINACTGKLYEAFAGLSEYLIPIDNIEFVQIKTDDIDQREFIRTQAEKIFKSKNPEINEVHHYSIVIRGGITYYILIVFDEDDMMVYCVDIESETIKSWDIIGDNLY